MKAFWKAMQTYFRTEPHTAFYTAVSGNMPMDVADGISLPYAVVSSPTGFPDYDLEGKAIESFTVQFDLYATTESAIQDLYEAFKTQFDDCSFTVSGFQLIEFRRVMNHKITEDGVKRYIIQYRVKLGV